jgi:hypothetical protein
MPLKAPSDRVGMFTYNRIIGHSECKECGCRASRREKPEKGQIEMEAHERLRDKND